MMMFEMHLIRGQTIIRRRTWKEQGLFNPEKALFFHDCQKLSLEYAFNLNLEKQQIDYFFLKNIEYL